MYFGQTFELYKKYILYIYLADKYEEVLQNLQ